MATSDATVSDEPATPRTMYRVRLRLRGGEQARTFWDSVREAESPFLGRYRFHQDDGPGYPTVEYEQVLTRELQEVLQARLDAPVRVWFSGYGSIKYLIEVLGINPPSAAQMADLAAACVTDILGLSLVGEALEGPGTRGSEANSVHASMAPEPNRIQRVIHAAFGSVGLISFLVAGYLLWITSNQWTALGKQQLEWVRTQNEFARRLQLEATSNDWRSSLAAVVAACPPQRESCGIVPAAPRKKTCCEEVREMLINIGHDGSRSASDGAPTSARSPQQTRDAIR